MRAPPNVHALPILTHLPGCLSRTASTSRCTHLTNTHTSAWLFVLYCEHLQMYTPHQYSHICLVARSNPNSYKIACLCFKAVTLSLTFYNCTLRHLFAPVSMDMHQFTVSFPAKPHPHTSYLLLQDERWLCFLLSRSLCLELTASSR